MSENNNKEQTQSQPTPQQQEQAVTVTQEQEQVNYKELYVRLAADLQNFKRRIDKERFEWSETAQGIIVSAFLPIFEDFDRAIETVDYLILQQGQQVPVSYLEGFKLIQKNVKKTLADVGINEIDTTGQFNPEYHEALTQVDSSAHTSGTIVQTLSKGYMFKGKVLKHAQVSVAK